MAHVLKLLALLLEWAGIVSVTGCALAAFTFGMALVVAALGFSALALTLNPKGN